MIKDFQNLPALAKWFLQSSLPMVDTNELSSDSENNNVILNSQELLAAEICDYVSDFQAKKSNENLIEYVMISGEDGIGKSTVLKRAISKMFSEGHLKSNEVLCVSVKVHSSLDSFYSLCSQLASKFNLRKDSAALEELEGSQERKDVAVLNVLKNFKLVFFDDCDADAHEIWQHVLDILKNFNQSILIMGTCVSVKRDNKGMENVKEFHMTKLHDNEVIGLFCDVLFDADGKTQIPQPYVKLADGNPLRVKIMSEICNHFKNKLYLIPYLPKDEKANGNENFAQVISSQLNCANRHLLSELCKLRRPLPMKNQSIFKTLVNFGLAFLENRGSQAFISVPSSIIRMHKELTNCDLNEPNHAKEKTATELWKNVMSPKLQEILIGCQTENWTFVPESWNSVKDVGSEDRYNINDLINKANLYDPNLKDYDVILECLYHALLERDFNQSVALIFLIDRYTFWTGTCKAALSVLSYIETNCPSVPVPPQVVIRKARVLKNDGNIQGAIKVLDTVINNVEGIGSYRYNSKDDSNHVTALCVSIKGDILRGLGLWKEAAQTLTNSIDLTNALQRIEKKIISGSMAHLADTFRYMTIGDYNDVAKQLKLKTGHPLREAIRYATEAAQRCIFTPLFYLKNKRRAGDLSLMISKMLPDDASKYQYLENAAHEFREGLRCHDSISRLESKDQFYEFILAIQRLSLICKDEIVVQRIGENIGRTLEKLAKLLYEHHCLFPQQIRHTEYSILLINLALGLVDLPEIPKDDNLEMLNVHVPVVEVKPSENVKSLSTIKDERVQEITSIIDVSSNQIVSQPEDQLSTSKVWFRDESTVADKTEEENALNFRNAVTIVDSKSCEEGHDEKAPMNKGGVRLGGAIGAISRALPTQVSIEPSLKGEVSKLSNIRSKSTEQSMEDGYESDVNHKESCQSQNIAFIEHQESLRSLRNASTTVDECYATAEDESVLERNIRVKGTINTLEASDKLKVNWQNVEKLHTGIRLTSDVHRALQLLYDVKTNEWREWETLAYIGEKLKLGKKEGACRDAFNFEFLEQDDPLRKYIGKQYKLEKYKNRPRLKKQYEQDIKCQSLSRFYATLFNKSLYQNPAGRTIGQVQFLPAVLIEIIDIENEAERYYNVEPFIAGEFVKISNNFSWTVQGDVPGKELLMAFSHHSYCSSKGDLIIVDIQGWTSEEKGGQTYLTDPQIHTMDRQGFGTANRGKEGFLKFWTEQHPTCNGICEMLGLHNQRPNMDTFK